MNDKCHGTNYSNRFFVNKILQIACLLSGIAWFSIMAIRYYDHKNKYVFYHNHILLQSVIAIALILIFILTNFILYKIYGTSKVNINTDIKNKPIIIFDSILRATTLLFIGYIISAFTFLFWSTLILN